MEFEPLTECRFIEKVKERDKVGVWGFGNVSRDVVLTLVTEGLGKEIIFYGRPKEGYPNRAGAWIEDLKANTVRRPRMMGTNKIEDMAGRRMLDHRYSPTHLYGKSCHSYDVGGIQDDWLPQKECDGAGGEPGLQKNLSCHFPRAGFVRN
jgi:hypothetical protein